MPFTCQRLSLRGSCIGVAALALAACLAASTVLAGPSPRMEQERQTLKKLTDLTVPQLQARAEQGDGASQYIMGLRLERGLGVAQDIPKSIQWQLKAARNGIAQAQYRVAIMYRDGSGLNQDFDQALAWYKKAADFGECCNAVIMSPVWTQ